MTQLQEPPSRTLGTLLCHLLDTPELICVPWPKFRVLCADMAAEAVKGLKDPRLANVPTAQATYKWSPAGSHSARGDMRVILCYFGKSVEALRELVLVRDIVGPRPLDRRTRSASRTLDYAWPTSRHVPGEPDAGIFGIWERHR